MPQPQPEHVAQAWSDAFRARDVDAIMELYEPDAIWVSDTGDVVTGLDGIREVMAQFLALDADYEAAAPTALQSDGLALLCSDWIVRGRDPSEGLELSGRTADVLRRQPDGRWRYVIDAPYGGGPARATDRETPR